MKNLRWTTIATICLTALLILFTAWISRQKLLPQRVAQPLTSPLPQPTVGVGPLATSAPSDESKPDLSIYRTDPKWIRWNRQKALDPNFEWKTPISFYGKVVDQDGKPVEGVKVILQWTDLSPTGTSQKTVFTDSAGAFILTGARGNNLLVTQIYKEGYYRPHQGVQDSFEYAAFFEKTYHQPDSAKPVVFQLKKKGQVPKGLLVREAMMGVAQNGEPSFIDLATTHKSPREYADIAIHITKGPVVEAYRYDWEATIEGVNGAGMLESTEEFMFEAPENGYQEAYTYRVRASDPDWSTRTNRKYFVRAKNGKMYAHVEIEFIPKYQDKAAINVRFYVNPTGSRALEYDPNENIPD